ncbi:MAG: hypothetical protein J7J85_04950 [Deltaproteobacteria bacterium]|nr:hypothetical protein [Deltaproteobacteria bacterium]
MLNTLEKGGAITRITGELLKKPVFKNSLRSILNNIDAENGRKFVRALIWEDTETVLALLGALPSIANAAIKALDESLLQVKEKFPPQLLQELVGAIVQDIDKESLERAIQNLSTLINDLSPVLSELSVGAGSMKGDKDEGH